MTRTDQVVERVLWLLALCYRRLAMALGHPVHESRLLPAASPLRDEIKLLVRVASGEIDPARADQSLIWRVQNALHLSCELLLSPAYEFASCAIPEGWTEDGFGAICARVARWLQSCPDLPLHEQDVPLIAESFAHDLDLPLLHARWYPMFQLLEAFGRLLRHSRRQSARSPGASGSDDQAEAELHRLLYQYLRNAALSDMYPDLAFDFDEPRSVPACHGSLDGSVQDDGAHSTPTAYDLPRSRSFGDMHVLCEQADMQVRQQFLAVCQSYLTLADAVFQAGQLSGGGALRDTRLLIRVLQRIETDVCACCDNGNTQPASAD